MKIEYKKLDLNNLIGLYIVPEQYICAGIVPRSSGELIVWGWYPYVITGTKITIGGKVKLKCVLINRLGTTYEHNTFLSDGKEVLRDLNYRLEFYTTEEEAIQECSERNAGKKVALSRCSGHTNWKEVSKGKDKRFVANKLY